MSKIQFQDHPKVQELLAELFQQVAGWVNSEGDAKQKNADSVQAAFFDIIKYQTNSASPDRSAVTIESDMLVEEILQLLYRKQVSYGKAHMVLESAIKCLRCAVQHELWKESIRHPISVKNGFPDAEYISRADAPCGR